MKKILKNQELLMDLLPTLEELRQYKTNVRIAYNTVKSIKGCYESIKKYEETRLSILKEKADKDEKGNPIVKDNNYQFSDENVKKEVETQMRDLMDQNTEVELRPLSLDDFESIKEVKIQVFERLLHYGFVFEPEPEPEPVKLKKV